MRYYKPELHYLVEMGNRLINLTINNGNNIKQLPRNY